MDLLLFLDELIFFNYWILTFHMVNVSNITPINKRSLRFSIIFDQGKGNQDQWVWKWINLSMRAATDKWVPDASLHPWSVPWTPHSCIPLPLNSSPGCLRGISDSKDARQRSSSICLLYHTPPRQTCASLRLLPAQELTFHLHPCSVQAKKPTHQLSYLPPHFSHAVYFTNAQIFLDLSTTNCYHWELMVL